MRFLGFRKRCFGRFTRFATGLVGRLAPAVAFIYQAGEKAAQHKQWQPIVDKASEALAEWCKRWGITA